MALLLLVDDDTHVLDAWCASLSAEHELLVACNGAEAWAMLQTSSVQIVVTDLKMPLMSGGVLCEKIRDSEHFAVLPVILVSGELSPPAFVRYDSYLCKPVDIGELNQTIKRLVSKTHNHLRRI